MQNKAWRPNVLPSVACASGTTYTSSVESNQWGRGIRFYVTISSVTATGSNDSLYLCGLAPSGTTVIKLGGFTAPNMLSVAGTYAFDFYPGGWLPSSGIAASGNLLGVAGIHLPLRWAVSVVMGTGNAATIVVDAEILP
jgi:hypothetical protein